METILYCSEYLIITRLDNNYFIETLKKGMPVNKFYSIIEKFPEISVTNFQVVRDAINSAPSGRLKFGESKQRIKVDILPDGLKATISLCVSEEELAVANRNNLYVEILRVLNDNGVIYGIKHEEIVSNLCNNKPLTVAEGLWPVNGKDSVITMYKLKEVKPQLSENGKVDFYELNLINRVEEGEWLGERINPTKGVPGIPVTGKEIPAVPGKVLPLLYDRKTVKEVDEGEKTVLYALRKGAVHYENGIIGISNHLEILTDVDFKTGNVDFDGYLTVKGSVEDNFMLVATDDIEVLGEYGVGSVKEIISVKGSVYIRGGIAGKSKAIIKSQKNIYTKYVSDATIICEGSVFVGLYCINSNIIAKEVVLDSPQSQIIGGNISAEIRVASAIIGSPSEKRTCIKICGFEKSSLKKMFDELDHELKEKKKALNKLREELTSSEGVRYDILLEKLDKMKVELAKVEDERKYMLCKMKTKGEGAVEVGKRIYPNTMIEIKGERKEFKKELFGTVVYYSEGELKGFDI
jgi:uncharacterized protein